MRALDRARAAGQGGTETGVFGRARLRMTQWDVPPDGRRN